jgi:hypothetical protein
MFFIQHACPATYTCHFQEGPAPLSHLYPLIGIKLSTRASFFRSNFLEFPVELIDLQGAFNRMNKCHMKKNASALNVSRNANAQFK